MTDPIFRLLSLAETAEAAEAAESMPSGVLQLVDHVIRSVEGFGTGIQVNVAPSGVRVRILDSSPLGWAESAEGDTTEETVLAALSARATRLLAEIPKSDHDGAAQEAVLAEFAAACQRLGVEEPLRYPLLRVLSRFASEDATVTLAGDVGAGPANRCVVPSARDDARAWQHAPRPTLRRDVADRAYLARTPPRALHVTLRDVQRLESARVLVAHGPSGPWRKRCVTSQLTLTPEAASAVRDAGLLRPWVVGEKIDGE